MLDLATSPPAPHRYDSSPCEPQRTLRRPLDVSLKMFLSPWCCCGLDSASRLPYPARSSATPLLHKQSALLLRRPNARGRLAPALGAHRSHYCYPQPPACKFRVNEANRCRIQERMQGQGAAPAAGAWAESSPLRPPYLYEAAKHLPLLGTPGRCTRSPPLQYARQFSSLPEARLGPPFQN